MVSTRSRITTPVPTKKRKVDETELPFDADYEYFNFPLSICCEICKTKKEQEMKAGVVGHKHICQYCNAFFLVSGVVPEKT